MRNRIVSGIVVLTGVLLFSCAGFSQTSAQTSGKTGQAETKSAPAPDAKAANQAIYSGKHHEGSVKPHDLSGV
jgi:hypothetical protein